MIVVNLFELICFGFLALLVVLRIIIGVIDGIVRGIEKKQQKKIDEAFKDEVDE